MRLVVAPHKPDARKCIFTEGIIYFETSTKSIWGAGDKITLEYLDSAQISGKWLNLAAGDGRYNTELLRKADFVVASDIDECALSKLRHVTSREHKMKLQTSVFDIAHEFPFEDCSFDGVFCTGTLHLFPQKILQKLLNEIDRVVKPGGKIILDFATDVKRVQSNGKLYARKSDPQYTLDSAEKLLAETFKNYSIQLKKSEVIDEEFRTKKRAYKFSCNFILLSGEKNIA